MSFTYTWYSQLNVYHTFTIDKHEYEPLIYASVCTCSVSFTWSSTTVDIGLIDQDIPWPVAEVTTTLLFFLTSKVAPCEFVYILAEIKYKPAISHTNFPLDLNLLMLVIPFADFTVWNLTTLSEIVPIYDAQAVTATENKIRYSCKSFDKGIDNIVYVFQYFLSAKDTIFWNFTFYNRCMFVRVSYQKWLCDFWFFRIVTIWNLMINIADRKLKNGYVLQYSREQHIFKTVFYSHISLIKEN